MDALLRYLLYHIAFTLIGLEVLLMLFCGVSIVIVKFITKKITTKRQNLQNQLSSFIEDNLFNDKPLGTLSLSTELQNFRNLVETLERYDNRFNDDRWVQIKHELTERYLFPSVESYMKSWSWFKRQLAARALLLYPQKAKEHQLKHLLSDNRYLVRVAAAVCITRTSYKKLFYEVLQKMNKETSLSQFPYRDALINTDQEKHHWIEEILSKEKNKSICAICLDVLSTRYTPNLFSLVERFTNDSDSHCRLLAIRAMGNMPSEQAIDILISHLSDSNWEIRVESILGLQKLYAVHAISSIKYLLNDPIWWVRLQAAMTLKSFGREGKDILNNQDVNQSPLAYEIAQYTLALPV